MKIRSSDLKQRLKVLLDEARGIEANPAGDGALTADQETRAAAIMTEAEQLEARIARVEKLEEAERRSTGTVIAGPAAREWDALVSRFELRQVALALDEGAKLSGPTAEIVTELRGRGGYRGIPVPLLALERRNGETIAATVTAPVQTRPIVDRLFPDSIAAAMGCEVITIDQGEVTYPVVSSSVTAGWANGETASVAGPTVYTTGDKSLAPDSTLGITMKVTRKSLKQAGQGLEDAIRRDMAATIAAELDYAAFNGTGSSGQPTGIIHGAAGYGITATDAGPASTWADFRAALTRFMTANVIGSPAGVRLAITPAVWDLLESQLFDEGSGVTELDRLMKFIPSPVISPQLAAGTSLLTVSKNGVAPFVCGLWGAVDVIRDPYSDAASGGLRLTGLVTADFQVLRPAQIEVLQDLGS